MFEWMKAQIVKLYTRRCDVFCGDESVHSAHLTPLGRRHYGVSS